MPKNYLVLLLLILPLSTWAQFILSGKIINITDQKPVAKASVYLSNTTIGSATADDGTFTLLNIKPGHYVLIISIIGFETFYQPVVINHDVVLGPVGIVPQSINLQAVVIKPKINADWEKLYVLFKQEFFGTSAYAAKCSILNPELLDFDFDKNTQTLTAYSNGYLDIVNRALGYQLHFQLKSFIKDYSRGYLYYDGDVLFKPLTGKAAQQKQWSKNRLDAYLGSGQHFFRSCITDQITEEGFKVLELIRKPNPERPPDSLLQAKSRHFRTGTFRNIDSLSYWTKISDLPKTISSLQSKLLEANNIFIPLAQYGTFALNFKNHLYVMYTKKRSNAVGIFRPENIPDNLTTIVSLMAPQAAFDRNGVIVDPKGVLFEGDWGFNRVARLLPIDYEPSL